MPLGLGGGEEKEREGKFGVWQVRMPIIPGGSPPPVHQQTPAAPALSHTHSGGAGRQSLKDQQSLKNTPKIKIPPEKDMSQKEILILLKT